MNNALNLYGTARWLQSSSAKFIYPIRYHEDKPDNPPAPVRHLVKDGMPVQPETK
jgi:hypothetical protein